MLSQCYQETSTFSLAQSPCHSEMGQPMKERKKESIKQSSYILELQKGEIFPVCEVCLSGEPDGPTGIDAGYWEKL